jgi:adenosine deaminase
MNEVITVDAVKGKVNQAERDIAAIINKLQEETKISVKAIMLFLNQLEVARNDEMKLKIEYDL